MNGTTLMTGGSLGIVGVESGWTIVGAADLDGDGAADLVWQQAATGMLAVWSMNGMVVKGYDYLSPAQITDPNFRIVGITDVDGDGKPDLVWHNQSTGMLAVWLMNGHTMTASLPVVPGAVPPVWQLRAMILDLRR